MYEIELKGFSLVPIPRPAEASPFPCFVANLRRFGLHHWTGHPSFRRNALPSSNILGRTLQRHILADVVVGVTSSLQDAGRDPRRNGQKCVCIIDVLALWFEFYTKFSTFRHFKHTQLNNLQERIMSDSPSLTGENDAVDNENGHMYSNEDDTFKSYAQTHRHSYDADDGNFSHENQDYDMETTPPNDAPIDYDEDNQGAPDEEFTSEYTPTYQPPSNYDEDYSNNNDCPEDDDYNLEDILEDTNQTDESEANRKHAEDLLSGRDSILEPNITDAIDKLIHLYEWTPKNVVDKLVQGYTGSAQMIYIVNDWLNITIKAEKKHSDLQSNYNENIIIPTNIDIDSTITSQLAHLIKQKFDKSAVDSLLDKGSEVPSWLLEMMLDSVWRRLLIELYDQNRGSALLGYCLRKISAMGYHRDIADIIGEADYFQVFDDLLVDTLQRIIQSSEKDLEITVKNIRRTCCSSEYTFLYALELLLQVERDIQYYTMGSEHDNKNCTSSSGVSGNLENKKRKADEEDILTATAAISNDVKNESNIETAAIVVATASSTSSIIPLELSMRTQRKIRRLRQDIEGAQIWGKSDSTANIIRGMAGLPLFAIKLTDMYHTGGGVDKEEEAVNNSIRKECQDMMKRGTVDGVHVQRLVEQYISGWDARSSSMKTEELIILPEDLTTEKHKQNQNQSQLQRGQPQRSRPSVRFLRHPQVVDLLIDALIHPKKALPITNTHVAVLLALSASLPSVVEVEVEVDVNNKDSSSTTSTKDETVAADVTVVMRSLLRARELCLEMNTAAFLVLPVLEIPTELIGLMKIPIVSKCILHRVLHLIRDKDFVSGNAYANILPIFLEFVIVSTDLHPLQRPYCFTIMKDVLQQSPETDDSGLSSRTDLDCFVISSRTDALNCFMHIMGSGYVMEPLLFLKTLLPTLDAKLIRHLVLGILNMASPPYSEEFATKIAEIITHKSVRDAIARHLAHDGLSLLNNFCTYISSNSYPLSASLVLELKSLESLLYSTAQSHGISFARRV
eukprot:gene4821-9616_t